MDVGSTENKISCGVPTLETDMVNSISGLTAQKIMLYHDGLQQLEEMLSNA